MTKISWKIPWIILIFFALDISTKLTKNIKISRSDQVIQDEPSEAEIIKAVHDSMVQWRARQIIRFRQKRAASTVCYPSLGCFSSSGHFSYLDTLPSPPDDISTTFLMYQGKRNTRSITFGNNIGSNSLLEVPFNNMTEGFDWAKKFFNASKPTKILVHGFGSSCRYIWVYEMRSALMSVDDFNIVCVDWENGAVLPNYVKAAANTRLVGKQLAMLLKGLEDEVGLTREKMHLIGFSLGAHVAGFAGSEMKNLSRITGLDPAGPLFEFQEPEARLDSTDANFVDVIHSNGENLFFGGLGSWQPMGHVDFYPNGGRMQKGCSNLFVGAVSDFIWSTDIEGRSLCNHRRAYKFFIDSLSPRCYFPAFPCESFDAFLAGKCFPCGSRPCGNMGYFADKAEGRGQLFLVTRDEEPFCAHQYNVKIESAKSDPPIKNYGKIQLTLIGDLDLNETFTLTSKEDEQLVSGEIISRIIVPHPIISKSSKVQVLYQGYAGWISSGLKKWKINKVSLMDSYGTTSSYCNKNLELESGIPVTLHLFPGNCNVSENNQTNDQELRKEDRFSDSLYFLDDTIGNESISIKFVTKFKPINLPEQLVPISDKQINNRTFLLNYENQTTLENVNSNKNVTHLNNKSKNDIVTFFDTYFTSKGSNETKNNETRRSHNINLDKEITDIINKFNFTEINEPVLNQRTENNRYNFEYQDLTEPFTEISTIKTSFKPYQTKYIKKKEKSFSFYKSDESDWTPHIDNTLKTNTYSTTTATKLSTNNNTINKSNNPLNIVITTAQFLPEKLSQIFEQAEEYAKEKLHPLMNQQAPKSNSQFTGLNESHLPKLIPLFNNESSTERLFRSVKIDKKLFLPPNISVSPLYIEETNKNSAPIQILNTSDIINTQMDATTDKSMNPNKNLTPFTNINRRNFDYSEVKNTPKTVYVDLPVHDDKGFEVKYIPLASLENIKEDNVT